MAYLAARLRNDEHYPRVKTFSEDPGNTKDYKLNATDQGQCGDTLDDILEFLDAEFSPSNPNRPKALALIGYSHGGGLAYLVSERTQTTAFDCCSVHTLMQWKTQSMTLVDYRIGQGQLPGNAISPLLIELDRSFSSAAGTSRTLRHRSISPTCRWRSGIGC